MALIYKEAGTKTALLIEALTHRSNPRFIVLELLPREPPSGRWRRLAFALWSRTVERFCLRHGMRLGHALSSAEAADYRRRFGLSEGQLRFVPWALSRGSGFQTNATDASPRGVFASGRALTDWRTLFAAAAGTDWELTVVSGAADSALIGSLNEDGRATVLREIPRSRHDELLAQSAVCVIPLLPEGPGAGHLRKMSATDAGIPVVATDVPGMADYASDGETALLVPPGDPTALRAAVEHVLSDPALAEHLRMSAASRARAWSYPDYFEAIGELLRDAALSNPG